MQASRVVRIVSLAVTFLLPAAIAAASDEALPHVTPFIDSEPGPPSKWTGNAPVPPDPATTEPRRWYGGQIIAADLGTLTCVALMQNGACLIPYLFAGAAIHGFHGRAGRAWLSVGLRASVPIVGGLVGGLIGGCVPFQQEQEPRRSEPSRTQMGDTGHSPVFEFDFDINIPPCAGEAIVGMLVGVAAGMALDAALGFNPGPPPVANSPARAAVRLAPRLSFGQANLSLGLSATF